MNVMDPHLRLRLADWLAFHLSNFGYSWPWERWQHVLTAPPYDGQRWVVGCVSAAHNIAGQNDISI